MKIDINGKKYIFDNIDQALTSILANRKAGDTHTAEGMEVALSSILKSKADGVDLLRVHSPTLQLLSYSMEIGKLLQNKATLDNFRIFNTKDENGIPTKEAAFIAKLFPDGNASEKLENIIGINRKDTGKAAAIHNGMAAITRTTAAGILAGRLGTFVQPLFSSVPKGALVFVRNAFA